MSHDGDESPTRMLRQLSTCVSDESCAMKCAFDFDYDDEEFYVIDDDEDDEDDDDEYCINNDGAYWKTPGIHPLVCTTFFEPQEQEELPPWDNYDHETLTTRFSRQTSATLESILGGSSSLLSPSANYIIEDLHLLEQRSHKSADDDKKRSTLAKVRDNRAPFNSPMVSQQKPSRYHHRHHHRAAQAVVTTDSGRHAPSPLHQNLNSPTSPTSTNHHTATTSEAIANPKATKSPTALLRRRWSNLSPTFFGSKTPSPRSPQEPSLPPIVESSGDDAKSKNTHPSTATSSGFLLHHEDDDDDEEEEEHSPYHHRNRALELTLSGSILELTLSESIQEEQSEIIRLDSIISHQSSLFFSINEDDMVVLEKISKRKRMWNKFRFRVAAWKRIAMFHLFPHRRAYTRFEI